MYLPKDRTKSTQFINFIITAENIEGPWSEPHQLEGAPGIDPDIFFDEDGKVWYVGTHSPENPNFEGEGEIWLQEIDLANWKLVGERHYLWRGACRGTWVEGPHMYRRDGRYYLMVAEGGTSFNHAVMIAVSDEITGPYISNPRNPILTTRHLSYDNWVNSTGHTDLVELPDGIWYMVALGIRGEEGFHSNMGRETHLLPVQWEREPFEWKKVKYEYPVCAPQTGRVERFTALPFADKPQFRNNAFHDNFDAETLNLEWNFRRVPLENVYSLSKRPNWLRLHLLPDTISLRGRCSQMGIRQKESNFEYRAKMEFQPNAEGAEAGISLFLQDDNYINMTVIREGKEALLKLKIKERNKEPRIAKSIGLKDYEGKILFQVISRNGKYRYTYSLDEGSTFALLAETDADLILCHGYTGVYLGLYGSSNGGLANEYADFDYITYQEY